MLQQADILASIKARWDRDSSLTSAVPGGMHHAENTDTKEPWARMWLEEGEIEWNSSKFYTQEWTLNLGVFSTKGPIDAGKIGKAVDALFNRDRPQDFLLPPPARMLATWPEPGTLEIDENSREARAVLVQGRRYRLLIQAER